MPRLFSFLLSGLVATTALLAPAAADEQKPHPLDYAPDFSKDPAPPFPPVTNPDGSNITVESWRGTRLFGWKGCSNDDINIITETYKQFHKLASAGGLTGGIDWDSQAAREIWGLHVTDEAKGQISQIYDSTKQIYDKQWWDIWEPPWLAWRMLWIEARCSPDGDEEDKCGDKEKPPPDHCPDGSQPTKGKPTGIEAFSNPLGKYSRITFCSIFFNGYPNDNGRVDPIPSLDEVIDQAKKQSQSWKNDLWNYQNRARIFFHEMTHMNYFVNAPGKSPFVDDVRIKFKQPNKKNPVTQTAYGPENVKILANYVTANKGGFYQQRNADSFAWFAMSKYIEQEVKLYPYEPVEIRKPTQAPRRGDGKTFVAEDDSSVDTSEEDTSDSDGHWIPGCSDHPAQASDLFGETSVTDKATMDCPKDQLSGVPYNVFYGAGFTTDSVFNKFCYNVDTTTRLKWTVDSHGNQKQGTTKRAMLRMKPRTPPPNPDTYDSFSFDLEWSPDTSSVGCGQNPMSCHDAFGNLANSPCGHQSGEQNILTAQGKITLPGCGSYSYKISGPHMPAPAPTTTTTTQPPGPTYDPNSDAAKECGSNLGASNCKADDNKCLVDQCKADKSCQDSHIDCDQYNNI